MQDILKFIALLTFSDWIAFSALLISLYSVYYTHKENRHRILVTESSIIMDDPYNPPMIRFSLFNDSKSSVTIINLIVSSIDSSAINFLADYEPTFDEPKTIQSSIDVMGIQIPTTPHIDFGRAPHPIEYQNPFRDQVLIPSNQGHEFSYYVAEPIVNAEIIVTTEQRLRYFKHSQSFIVKFSKLN